MCKIFCFCVFSTTFWLRAGELKLVSSVSAWMHMCDVIRKSLKISVDIRIADPGLHVIWQMPYYWWWRCLCSCSTRTVWLRTPRWRPQFGQSGCCQNSRGSLPSSLHHSLHSLLRFHSSAHLLPGLHPGCQRSWTNPLCGRDSMTCRPTAPQRSGWTRWCTDTAEPPTETAWHTSSRLSQTLEHLSKTEGRHLWEETMKKCERRQG